LGESLKVVVLVTWTCSHCGTRQVFTKPNTCFQFGECYKCGKVTRIKAYRPQKKEMIAA